ncbi:MAPEG family protein [Sphingomicrobium sediminis]|uniref:MAPEG family protein n=1 Tax=Sphingomicrobium sediminis TaxID=2950949 RepID=A0A9X2EFZ5_9SPHN|nr:MAPEG family protein [Sphingomicrobium sediminis]MCM8556820.1 MAPEG family protein [Sphingomicrobium sediminis]
MEFSPLIGPIIALVAWTIVMMFWAVIRIQKAIKSGADLSNVPAGARGRDLEGHIPPRACWPRQNYEHLVEQPTLFYAIVIAIVLMGGDHVVNLYLAWGYVALRIGHSLVQVAGKSRSLFFVTSTLCLMALTLHAAIEFISHM